MKSKKGGVLDDNLIGTIIAIASVAVLLVLLFNLFASFFDKGDKTAESYFDSFGRAIETADADGEGDFFMMDDGDNYLKFYLAYFGGTTSFGEDGKNFVRSKQGENIICVCCRKGGNMVCNYCEDMKFPIKYISEIKKADGENPQVTTGKISEWVVRENERIIIVKKEGYYEFTKI